MKDKYTWNYRIYVFNCSGQSVPSNWLCTFSVCYCLHYS